MVDAYNELMLIALARWTVLPAWVGLEVYIAYATLGVLILFGWWSWAGRRDRRREKREARELATEEERAGKEMEEDSGLGHRGITESGVMHADSMKERVAPEQIFFPTDATHPSRRCPSCDRRFPGLFEICPYDTTPLVEVGSDSARRTKSLPRRFCPDCGRRYGASADYCYVDGYPLTDDFEAAAELAPVFRVCRECGLESEKPLATCPRDGEKMEVLDPRERGHITPTIPFNRCRRCGHLGAPDETICPVDGTLMLPELSARIISLPPTGYGFRRRICKECGSLFGDQCQYCAFDGNDLIPLN